MSNAALGMTMLALIVAAIMMGFPTAFTLMGLGILFGYVAFHDAGAPFWDNRIFDLMVERAFGAMNNDTLLSIPLFVLMGYVMERGALVDRMFHSVQLAFRHVPGSLAVTTLIICTFWGIASGLVGAVVVLMGVIAMRPMLHAGYDTRLAAGVITAGGTLGILIPPSVMIIVYAAVAGQSVVKLYAAAMFPGFFLALLYLLYVIGWVLLNPRIAPPLPPEQMKVPVPDWLQSLSQAHSRRMLPALASALLAPSRALAGGGQLAVDRALLLRALVTALAPLLLVVATLGTTWWYVAVHAQRVDPVPPLESPASVARAAGTGLAEPPAAGTGLTEPPSGEEPSGASASEQDAPRLAEAGRDALPESLGGPTVLDLPPGVPASFYAGFWLSCLLAGMLLAWYYRQFDAEQLEILRLLVSSVFPLALLTFVVLAVILLGITTATESAAVGALGAFLMAWHAGTLNWPRIKEAVFLTARTTTMVCWLFVGSAIFSAVFALLGGQRLVEEWVLAMDLSPVQFLLLSQALIFVLGWPLEWTEIIVIFVPIFLPLLQHFQIDPILWGVLVFVNLQAAFLSPPVAMSAFYLKGVSPPHVTINEIFAGMMPYMAIVILCMVLMYAWPQLTLWLPDFLYGK